jgi:hypothetical protein
MGMGVGKEIPAREKPVPVAGTRAYLGNFFVSDNLPPIQSNSESNDSSLSNQPTFYTTTNISNNNHDHYPKAPPTSRPGTRRRRWLRG